jgi:hypothetical protein
MPCRSSPQYLEGRHIPLQHDDLQHPDLQHPDLQPFGIEHFGIGTHAQELERIPTFAATQLENSSPLGCNLERALRVDRPGFRRKQQSICEYPVSVMLQVWNMLIMIFSLIVLFRAVLGSLVLKVNQR